MTIDYALAALGVREDTLSEADKTQLDRDGYLVLPEVLTPDQVEAFRVRLDQLLTQEGSEAGRDFQQEAGTDRLGDLVNKNPIFDACWLHPRLLAAVYHLMQGPFKLSSVTSRAALPGQGHQALHPDWGRPVERGTCFMANSVWPLDDFTANNGATRVVPGSHRIGQVPSDVMADPTAPHPDEIKLLAPAGSAVVFNAHLWHSGTRNDSDRPRRAIFPVFVRRDQEPQTDQRAILRPETATRLSAAAKFILSV
jgi:ectoine hydroxylase-related dioxygenase (phytanoyl-CoA dioxygenase family)